MQRSSHDVAALQVTVLVATAPAALVFAAFFTGCHAAWETLPRAGIAWFLGALAVTTVCVVRDLNEWRRHVLRLFVACVAVAGFGALLESVGGAGGGTERGRQKETMSSMRDVGNAIELALMRGDGQPPPLESVADVSEVTGLQLTEKDAWGTPLHLTVVGTDYCIVSYGMCGKPDVPQVSGGGPCAAYPVEEQISDFECDIVFRNGCFVRWP